MAVSPAKAPGNGANVVTKAVFDRKVMYVGRRVRTASIRSKTLGLDIPKLTEKGYLIVHGDKPGLIIHEVMWDGEDMYRRDTAKGSKFGSLKALNSTKHAAFRAEIIDKDELIRRAIKRNHVVQACLVDDASEHTVALLNDNGHPYVAAIEINHGHIQPRNMEPPRPYNRHAKGVRFTSYKDVKTEARRFLAGVR